MILLKNHNFIHRSEAKTDIEDRGYTFGDGVYEVIRIYNGAYFMLEYHLNRLQYSLNEVGINYDVESEDLETLLSELLNKNTIEDGAIYLQITRGIAPRKHPYPTNSQPELYAYPIPVSSPKKEQEQGVHLTLVEDLRWLRCDIKSLNLLYNVMVKQKAVDSGAYEALLYRSKDHITEGSSSNFFGIKNGKVLTHPANNYILNGITRIAVQKICKSQGIPFVEKVLSVDELAELDEAFIASTTAEVVPVTKIDDVVIGDGTVGEIAKKLQAGFLQLI
ncbi:D-amino-acid transaminase [Salirhabdus sp. Marseille-P4669]|uniref:D-amino-acid transaminase n=1 Tax=Salirhabdus sp. Marseille-P4669 TaxID=2042310 RepID=UPI000C7C5ACD|nr:D-amino-acid transaminase [Salirhabdus sp. Marseille-P4669]